MIWSIRYARSVYVFTTDIFFGLGSPVHRLRRSFMSREGMGRAMDSTMDPVRMHGLWCFSWTGLRGRHGGLGRPFRSASRGDLRGPGKLCAGRFRQAPGCRGQLGRIGGLGPFGQRPGRMRRLDGGIHAGRSPAQRTPETRHPEDDRRREDPAGTQSRSVGDRGRGRGGTGRQRGADRQRSA